MDGWKEVIGERDSEFNGLKGRMLRYGGVTFVLLIAIQLIKALMLSRGFTSAELYAPFLVLSAAAFIVYPIMALCLRRRIVR